MTRLFWGWSVEASADIKMFRFWISGYVTRDLDPRCFWRIVHHPIVLAIVATIGFVTGALLGVTLHLSGAGNNLWALILFTTLQPFLINIQCYLFVKIVLFLFVKRGTSLTIPSILAYQVSAIPAFFVLDLLLLYVLGFGIPVLYYVLISFIRLPLYEVLTYLAFRYLADDIVGARPDTGATAHAEPAREPASRMLTIGAITVMEHEIIMLEAQGNYIRVLTRDGEFLERYRFSDAVDRIDERFGLIVHRSFWVGYDYIDGYQSTDGKAEIHLSNGTVVKIASTRKAEVRRTLKDRGISLRHLV